MKLQTGSTSMGHNTLSVLNSKRKVTGQYLPLLLLCAPSMKPVYISIRGFSAPSRDFSAQQATNQHRDGELQAHSHLLCLKGMSKQNKSGAETELNRYLQTIHAWDLHGFHYVRRKP